MDDELPTKRVFNNCLRESSARCKTWCYRVQIFYMEIEHADICNDPSISVRAVLMERSTELRYCQEKTRSSQKQANYLQAIERRIFTENYVKVAIQK